MELKDGHTYEIISQKSAVAYLKTGLLQCDCTVNTRCQENGLRHFLTSPHAIPVCGVRQTGSLPIKPTQTDETDRKLPSP